MKKISQGKGMMKSCYINSNRTSSMLPKRRKDYFFDDFLNQIISMKERGDVSVCGKRIC